MKDVQFIIAIFVFVISIIIRIKNENKKRNRAKAKTLGTPKIVTNNTPFQPEHTSYQEELSTVIETPTTQQTPTKTPQSAYNNNKEANEEDNSQHIEQWRQAIISSEILKTKF